MKTVAAGIAIVLALARVPAFPADVPSGLTLQAAEPRAFGYTIGDVLQRRVLIDPRHDGAVDPTSLPKPGRVGRWLQLRWVNVLPGEVRLTYQIINAPAQIDQENLPALDLRVVGTDGRPREALITPFTVTIAPIGRFGAYDTVQASDLRPDLDPAPLDTTGARRWVLASAAALLAAGALLAEPGLVRRWAIGRARPFAAASRAIRRMKADANDQDARHRALRHLHRALDQTAGATLALDNLDLLFAKRPWLEPARVPLKSMLARSRAAFFDQAPPPPLEDLVALAAQCARLEQRQ